MAVHYIPQGFHAVTPYLVVDGAGRLIDFLQKVFGAQVCVRMDGPDGKVHHAELRIGDSPVELADAGPHLQVTTAGIHVYVPDVDAAYGRALAAGATTLLEPKDQFYGERSASVKDALGNVWHIATHTEDVTAEEMKRRAAALAK